MLFGWCAADSDRRCAMSGSHFDFAALWQAWQACRRGKRGTRKAQRFEIGLLDRLVDTAHALQTRAWHPSRASRFVTLHPKPREILAADFGDRVVHHLLVAWFERHFEPVFIDDSYANRRGKGTHASVNRLQGFARSYPPNQPGWYLQLDIANFFHSIDRRILFGLLRGRIERDLRRPSGDARRADASAAPDMLHLARVLLTGNPAQNADFRGNPAHLQRVPAHKQLINAAPEKGLPIGHLSSQFFANVYLNALDQFVKHQLKAHHYLRYVDDFVLLHHDPAVLALWRDQIAHFLQDHLGLTLRDAGRLLPIGNGIDFLGYVVRPHYRLVRQRVVGHLYDRLARHAQRIVPAGQTLVSPPAASDALWATLASYFGHFQHAQSRRLQAEVLATHPRLAHILASAGDGRVRRADRPARVSSLASQWRYFRARYPQHVLLVQVGKRWECQGPGDALIKVGFRPLVAQRIGLPATLSVPAAQVPAVKRLLTRHAQPWLEVCENGWVRGGAKNSASWWRCGRWWPKHLMCLKELCHDLFICCPHLAAGLVPACAGGACAHLLQCQHRTVQPRRGLHRERRRHRHPQAHRAGLEALQRRPRVGRQHLQRHRQHPHLGTGTGAGAQQHFCQAG